MTLGIGLVALLACSTAAPKYLTEQEIKALIENDIKVMLDHLDSLARLPYGKDYLADLLENNLTWSCELVWVEDEERREKSLGTYYDPSPTVTPEQVDKAWHHKVTLGLEDHPVAILGTWLIYPHKSVAPITPSTLSLQSELSK